MLYFLIWLGEDGMAVEAEAQSPQQAAEQGAQPTKNLLFTLSDGTKVKRRIPRQRACNEPGPDTKKGNICAGHLKRWFGFGDEIKQKMGPNPEIYRCEHCHTLYISDDQDQPRTLILRY
jgi:hypothetical protein